MLLHPSQGPPMSPLQREIRDAQRVRLYRNLRRWLVVTTLFAIIFLWSTGTRANDNSITEEANTGRLSETASGSSRTGDLVVLHQKILGGNGPADDDLEDAENDESPSMYGWLPTTYPNPSTNSIRCGVAYIQDRQMSNLTAPPVDTMPTLTLDASSPAQANEAMMGSADASECEKEEPLRLCDPDWCLGGVFLERVASQLHNFSQTFHDYNMFDTPLSTTRHVDLAVAVVRKMNLPQLLRQSSYYAYEDEEDMINDAAQIFSREIHDTWYDIDHGILIFVSIQDRVCFITTGMHLERILPWWRLDHISAAMKPDLRAGHYGEAVLKVIDLLGQMLQSGPPTFSDRAYDFVARFGVVILFAIFTFSFGAWGEYRDRKKRFQFAQNRSKLSEVERVKASLLQQEYRTLACPICLESFEYGDESLNVMEADEAHDDASCSSDVVAGPSSKTPLDRYGLPAKGPDGRRLKLLRCGHIFCDTCWQSWVHSGCGNPCNCPVCRQDVGRTPRKQRRLRLTPPTPHEYPTGNQETHLTYPSYDSLSQS